MIELIPEPLNIRTPLDEHGSVFNIDRITGESLSEYKLRILETNINKASSTYRGLINGLTRELGLAQERAFRISLKSLFSGTFPSVDITITSLTLTDTTQTWEANSLIGFGLRIDNNIFRIEANDEDTLQIASGDLLKFSSGTYDIVAYNPVALVDGTNLYLYKDFYSKTNFRLDIVIPLRSTNTFFSDLVDAVNTSTYFTASALIEDGDKKFAWSLEKQSSLAFITNEVVPAARNFHFKNKNIIENSVKFSERSIFSSEVIETEVSQLSGNFYVDYSEGFALANSLPSGRGTASYAYSKFPFEVLFSPVVINNFLDKSSQRFLFNQTEMRLYDSIEERFVPGQPKPDAIEYIAELLNVTPLAWGE